MCATSFPPLASCRFGVVANASICDRLVLRSLSNVVGFHPYDIAKFHRLLCRDSVVFASQRPQRRRNQGGEEKAYVFNLILLASQGDSPGQPKDPCMQPQPFATITVYSWWQPSTWLHPHFGKSLIATNCL